MPQARLSQEESIPRIQAVSEHTVTVTFADPWQGSAVVTAYSIVVTSDPSDLDINDEQKPNLNTYQGMMQGNRKSFLVRRVKTTALGCEEDGVSGTEGLCSSLHCTGCLTASQSS